MKITTPESLVLSYAKLHPSERIAVCEDTLRIFSNWLLRYQTDPEHALATTNWCGKVTNAFFDSLGIKKPKTKRAMLIALS